MPFCALGTNGAQNLPQKVLPGGTVYERVTVQVGTGKDRKTNHCVQPDAALNGHHLLLHPALSGSSYTPQQMGNQGLEKDKPLFKVPTGEGWEQRWLGGRLLLKNSILQPGVLAPRPAVLLACCDSGSLRLGFLTCVVRGLEKISEGFPIQWTLSWVSTLCLAVMSHGSPTSPEYLLPARGFTFICPVGLSGQEYALMRQKDWSPIPARTCSCVTLGKSLFSVWTRFPHLWLYEIVVSLWRECEENV